jgi:hypothetical protein
MSRRADLGLALLAIVTLLAPQPPSRGASDSDLPPIDPPGHWHYMTRKPAFTTSKCVGDVKSALCTIETLLACTVRVNETLCKTAADWPDAFYWYFDGDVRAPLPWAIKYRVIGAQRLASEPLPRAVWRESRAPQPGDLLVRLRIQECRYRQLDRCDIVMYHYIDYFLRKEKERWLITNYNNGPDVE